MTPLAAALCAISLGAATAVSAMRLPSVSDEALQFQVFLETSE